MLSYKVMMLNIFKGTLNSKCFLTPWRTWGKKGWNRMNKSDVKRFFHSFFFFFHYYSKQGGPNRVWCGRQQQQQPACLLFILYFALIRLDWTWRRNADTDLITSHFGSYKSTKRGKEISRGNFMAKRLNFVSILHQTVDPNREMYFLS